MLTQKGIADHIDLSQAAVSVLMGELGIDWKSASIDEIRISYIRRLREQAAGRAASGDLDLATERAGLARAQREKIEMQNAVTRGELTPTIVLEQILAASAAKIAGILDSIPGMVRRRVPILTAADIDLIAGEVAKARNTVAAMSISDLTESIESDGPELAGTDDGGADGSD